MDPIPIIFVFSAIAAMGICRQARQACLTDAKNDP
jgi:hypothetical protein